jgi:hypothetical protein
MYGKWQKKGEWDAKDEHKSFPPDKTVWAFTELPLITV